MKGDNASNQKQLFIGAYTSNDNLLVQESMMLHIEPAAINNGGNPAE